MGLRNDLLTDLAEAFNTDLADAVQPFTLYTGDTFYDPNSGNVILGEVNSTIWRGVFSKANKRIIEDGGEQSNVYFQTDDWDSYWTSKGESPTVKAYEISDEIGNQYTEAVSLGQDLQIPVSEYIQKLGDTENINELMDIVKTRE